MKINLITHDNGVGLTQDVAIMKDVLKDHECNFVEISAAKEVPRAHVNIFFELLKPSLYRYANINTYFPNPEWFWFGKDLKGIDIVFAKTRDAETIFRTLGCNVLYTSFTSRDLLDTSHRKEAVFVHLAGQSETKGTFQTYMAWRENPDFPRLFFCKTKGYEKYAIDKDRPNIIANYQRMKPDMLNRLLNRCYFHLCCSEYEGFGHYIWEAKSTGGIVITTGGPPMEDFVSDTDGFRVKVAQRKRQNYGTLSIIDRKDLVRVVREVISLSPEAIWEMSRKSRMSWEENDAFFRGIMVSTFNHFNT